MAKKTSKYPIESFSDSWEQNPKDGLPQSGQQVRQFLEDTYNDVNMRLFLVEEALENGSLELGFTDMPTGTVVVNGSAPYYIPMYIRSVLVSADGSETEYDRNVNLEIEVSINGRVSTTSIGTVDANMNIRVNITPYVANGAAFAFRVTNADGFSKRSTYYDVVMANIDVKPRDNNWWATPYVFNTIWSVPLSVNVNIPAVLRATLTDKEGIVRASETIPSAALSENFNLSLQHPILNGGESGIYTLRIELNAADETLNLSATPLEYKVVCLSADDSKNYLLVTNRGENFKNYASNRLFDYSVRVGYGNPSVRFIAKVEGEVVGDTGDMSAPAGVASYNLSLDLERLDTADFDVLVESYLDGEKVSEETFTFSNSEGYAATPGATTILRFNGRSNSETDREKFINAVDGSVIAPDFAGVNWTGADGYHDELLSDGSSRTVFRLLAGSRMTLPIRPLAMNPDDGRTIEIVYKVNNVRNFDSHIIECLDADGNGVCFSASEVSMQTPSAKKHDDQNVGLDDSEYIHATIVVRPQPTSGAVTVDNFSACMVYLNGCRNRWFAYNRDLSVDSNLSFGSDDADIDIVAVRIYDGVLTESEVEQNTCNMLPTEAEKMAFKLRNAIREGGKVDFARVRSMCNVIVFGAANLPTRAWTKDMSTEATIETYMLGDNGNTEKVDNLAWQGTTSHNYGIDDRFGGYGQNYKWTAADGTKMCAKANWASAMQSHKISMTAAYTDIAVACGIIPAGQRISILQKPMVGFHRKQDGSLQFIGLFTVGPDKGNKATFGWTSKSLFMEGSDNEPLGTNFLAPWNDDTVTVDSANEKYSVMGVKAWEDASKKPDYINTVWKPAYNFVYGCSQHIIPCNALTDAIDTSASYWTPDYDLFYYNATAKQWMSAGINLAAQLADYLTDSLDGKTAEEKNELFKAARRAMFKAHIEEYFNRDFFIYHTCFGEFFACTDNLSKNTYPFVLDCTGDDKRICWRQDDLDSSMPTENQGKNYKKYCVEVTDNYKDYGRDDLMVFNGTRNQFWLLVRECYASEIDIFMREKFIPSLKAGQAANALSAFNAWCDTYVFGNAQKHFSEALYNECGRLRYGYGHLSTGNTGEDGGYQYQGIALSQDCGNYYLGEKAWLRMRFIYMCSKYTCGQFAAGYTGDTFTTRPYSAEEGNTFEITPAIYMYPSVQNGQTVIRGERIYPASENKSWSVTLPRTEGDQEQRINGMSYIASLGALYNAAILGNVNVNGRMLVKLDVGTQTDTEHIRSRITGLGIGDATSLRELTLSNIETLQGVVDLSQCANLKKVYADGTGVTSIPLCDGGNLEEIHYPETTTQIVLHGKKAVTYMAVDGTDEITTIDVMNCNDYVTGQVLDILANLYQ